MTKRLLMLDDDQLERLLEWHLARETLGEPEAEDEELRDKISDARLAA